MVVVSSSAARTNCDYIDYIDNAGDGNNHDVDLHSIFEKFDFQLGFGLEFRILTPCRVEFIVRTLIFGLDTAIDR